MPKIRIREKDRTQGVLTSTNNTVIFLTDTGFKKGAPELVKSGKGLTNEEIIDKIISFGGKVVVGKDYATSADYLKDRNQYDVKFLLVKEGSEDTDLKKAIDVVLSRRDCAVVYSKTTPEYSENELSVLKTGVSGNLDDTDTDGFMSKETKSYAGKYVLPFYGNSLTLNGTSFDAGLAYILAFLSSARTNAEWLAVAGSKRGVIPVDLTVGALSESTLDTMQPRGTGTAINPIVNMNPWGVRIWGNRTALTLPTAEGDENLVASSFANVRVLICDIKKKLYEAARKYQFEQNTDVLWVNFQSSVNTLLEEMVQSYGIAGYKWIKEETSEKAKLKAILRIIPIEAIEDFDLTLELTDSLEVTE